tara:strand:- start:168 stop:788 length:621 start_codon:yes stop_codon:yes gene_type:complete
MAGMDVDAHGYTYNEYKEMLKAHGMWEGAHLKLREWLKGKGSNSAVDCKRMAIKPFLPDGSVDGDALLDLGWTYNGAANRLERIPGAEDEGGVGAGVTRERAKELVRDGDWKDVPVRESVEWVLAHLLIPGMQPEDAPSALAWNQWLFFSRDEGRQADYFKDYGSKFIPTRSQLEVEGRFEDRGESQADFIRECIVELEGGAADAG